MREFSESHLKSKQVHKQVDKIVREMTSAIMAKRAGKKWLYKTR